MDLKALREADDVLFRVALEKGRHFGEIVCKKRLEKKGPFDDEERTHVIANVRFSFDVYQEDWKGSDWVLTAFADSRRWSDHWRTATAALREGDEVEMAFSVDGGANRNVRDANLHFDMLYLRARREGAQRPLEWVVDWSIGPQNTARMVRRHARKEYDLSRGSS
jgi:hypothetical protein